MCPPALLPAAPAWVNGHLGYPFLPQPNDLQPPAADCARLTFDLRVDPWFENAPAHKQEQPPRQFQGATAGRGRRGVRGDGRGPCALPDDPDGVRSRGLDARNPHRVESVRYRLQLCRREAEIIRCSEHCSPPVREGRVARELEERTVEDRGPRELEIVLVRLSVIIL